MADSTLDFNVHDTYFIIGSYDALTILLTSGIILGSVLLLLSLKLFSKFKFLYFIIVFLKLCWVYTIIKAYTFISMNHLPTRYYTNSNFEIDRFYQAASVLIIPILLFLIVMLVITKLFSLRKRH
ncbi:hypothetical protein [Nonlabens dokdonensis]|uniref:hypothetical protein n=1 Tax=Nonlabens dokdonensis TaxID=328515 RepID=UPI0011B3BB23|nr:hypothetical protein [Nonlabens dokdonensis]